MLFVWAEFKLWLLTAFSSGDQSVSAIKIGSFSCKCGCDVVLTELIRSLLVRLTMALEGTV